MSRYGGGGGCLLATWAIIATVIAASSVTLLMSKPNLLSVDSAPSDTLNYLAQTGEKALASSLTLAAEASRAGGAGQTSTATGTVSGAAAGFPVVAPAETASQGAAYMRGASTTASSIGGSAPSADAAQITPPVPTSTAPAVEARDEPQTAPVVSMAVTNANDATTAISSPASSLPSSVQTPAATPVSSLPTPAETGTPGSDVALEPAAPAAAAAAVTPVVIPADDGGAKSVLTPINEKKVRTLAPVDCGEAKRGFRDDCTDWVAPPPAAVPGRHPLDGSQWIPHVSPCRVQGLPIEVLEPEVNFRRGYSLGFVGDVEDKTQILPFLRASVDYEMTVRPRRVYIDFGGNRFDTSTTWFLRTYPMDFTEIHAFEVVDKFYVIPEPKNESFTTPDVRSRFRLQGGPQPFPAWVLDKIKAYNQYVGTADDVANKRINATRWMLEELKLTAADTVVVKMDIEGAEWDLLEAWMKTPGLEQIVDELFVEVHYFHDSMHYFQWRPDHFKHTRDEAVSLFNRLRAAGFYAHPWP